jgi:hypothetical protein
VSKIDGFGTDIVIRDSPAVSDQLTSGQADFSVAGSIGSVRKRPPAIRRSMQGGLAFSFLGAR